MFLKRESYIILYNMFFNTSYSYDTNVDKDYERLDKLYELTIQRLPTRNCIQQSIVFDYGVRV